MHQGTKSLTIKVDGRVYLGVFLPTFLVMTDKAIVGVLCK